MEARTFLLRKGPPNPPILCLRSVNALGYFLGDFVLIFVDVALNLEFVGFLDNKSSMVLWYSFPFQRLKVGCCKNFGFPSLHLAFWFLSTLDIALTQACR